MKQLISRPGECLHKDSPRSRICIVRYGFYPAELNITREAHALRDVGYEVHVICLKKQTEFACDVIEGVHVHRMRGSRRRGALFRYIYDYNLFFLLATYTLLSLHRQRRICAVQVNTMPDYLVFCTIFLKLTWKLPVILHMHEPMPELFQSLFNSWYHRPFLWAIRLMERASLAYADRVITVTREMRDTFARRSGKWNKIRVVLNVPDHKLLRADVHRPASVCVRGRRPFRVVCHGTIEERYGLDVIVRAISILGKEIPEIEFRFMGEGDCLDSLLSLSRQLAVAAHVRYLGFVSVDFMVQEIKKADVAVIAMKRSPYSVLVHTNKMYEYMALGRPIIASRLASVQAYFPEDTILYFNPGDEHDLAEQLRYAFIHPEQMNERVERTSLLYNRYRWDCEKATYLSVYNELLEIVR